ncbi:MAG: nicotinate-nucleotide--dimethylbenzimidazole phosphoribosyltransferase [Lachnospiraceae bacterium]
MNLETTIKMIKPLNAEAMTACKNQWNQIAKPIGSLGKLEEIFMQIAGIMGTEQVQLHKKALIVMCADNGVVAEGVTQTDSSVTRIVADNFASGATTACIMAKRAGVDLFPIDIGVQTETKIANRKIALGTKNMALEPAMTRTEAIQAIEVGIQAAKDCKDQGYTILATGEMGIGNTSTSSAMASVLLGTTVESVTGKGAGLTFAGFKHKIEIIEKAIAVNHPDAKDPLDVLSKVGGLDIAGLVGVFLGGAALGMPVIIDGFISAVAAFTASKLSSLIRSYAIPSHTSLEPAMQKLMEQMYMSPCLDCNMKLGEGTGAIALMPLLDMAYDVYTQMSTFEDIEIEPYQPMGCH